MKFQQESVVQLPSISSEEQSMPQPEQAILQRPLPPQEELRALLKDPAREQRYHNLIAEVKKSTPQRQSVQISPEVRAQLQALVKEKLEHMLRVDEVVRIYHAGYEGDDGVEGVTRSMIKARMLLRRQINPADGTLQENLTLTEADFQFFVRLISSFVVMIANDIQCQQQTLAAAQHQQQRSPQLYA
jgi:hypothetical protein